MLSSAEAAVAYKKVVVAAVVCLVHRGAHNCGREERTWIRTSGVSGSEDIPLGIAGGTATWDRVGWPWYRATPRTAARQDIDTSECLCLLSMVVAVRYLE